MLIYFICCLLSSSAAGFPEKVLDTDNGPVTEKVEGRIGSGKYVGNGNYYRFQVQIFVENRDFCSGSIIGKHYILTAANCVYRSKLNEITVKAGSYYFRYGNRVPIAKISIPKNRDYARSLDMDVAVMRTVKPFKFDGNLSAIQLADYDTGIPKSFTISGWGRTQTYFFLSDVLLAAEIPIVSLEHCASSYYYTRKITNNMFCAGKPKDKTQGLCDGDIGGPAIDKEKRRLVGIGIFSRACGMADVPSVFTSVLAPEVREFILKNTEDNKSSFGGTHPIGNHSDGDHCDSYQNSGDRDGGDHDDGNCGDNESGLNSLNAEF